MWSAIKNDLFDFVSTIKEDTSKQVSKVIGASGDKEDDERTAYEQAVSDLRRSFSTYDNAVDSRDFDKFLRKFSLTSHNVDIAEVLDAEPDVSRYYAELVPAKLQPEQFWARYYFKLQLLNKASNSISLDDDDEEEDLTWDEGNNDTTPAAGISHSNSTHSISDSDSAPVQSGSKGDAQAAATLEADNAKLKQCVRSLTRRVAELESLLKEKDEKLRQALAQLAEYNNVVPAVLANMQQQQMISCSASQSTHPSPNQPSTQSTNTVCSPVTLSSGSHPSPAVQVLVQQTASVSEVAVRASSSAEALKSISRSSSGNGSGHAVHVHRNDSVSSISDAETCSDSSVVVVSSHVPAVTAAGGSTSALRMTAANLNDLPSKAAMPVSASMISLDESDDDDGGWS